MRFSINTVLFVSPFTSANTNLFKNFKRWGYDAVEILIEDPSDIDVGQVKRELSRNGLACGSVCAAMSRLAATIAQLPRVRSIDVPSQRRSIGDMPYLCAPPRPAAARDPSCNALRN